MIPSTAASATGRGASSLRPPRRRGASLIALVLGLGLLLQGCEPSLQVHGHMPDADALSQIKVGATSREQVRELMGSPTAIGAFDDKRWYYISRKTETGAFDVTTLLDQEVVAIAFDEGGFVSAVEREQGIEKTQEVALVDREIPTKGRELGFFEQILGNFGGGRVIKKNPEQPSGTIGRPGRRR
jgi:outer membrane protein assembly factor BamE (lipoprotein component of BamABCDE complex)